MIKWLSLPELASTPNKLVDLTRRVSLDLTEDLPQEESLASLNQDVRMIWHDDESLDVIPRAIKMKQGIGNQNTNRGQSKLARSMAFVQVLVPASMLEAFQFVLQFVTHLIACQDQINVTSAQTMLFQPLLNLIIMPTFDDFVWHRICQSVCNERHYTWHVDMRQVASRHNSFGVAIIRIPLNRHISHVLHSQN